MRYVVGIDLGTTNSALGLAPLEGEGDPLSQIDSPPIDQLVAPGELGALPLLPSSLYLLEGPELPRGSARLPWGEADLPYLVGQAARRQGAAVPGRLVESAKSWLSHPSVDRQAKILPWGASEDLIEKVSPVEASARYLAHIRAAWDEAHPDEPLADQDILLTVPPPP